MGMSAPHSVLLLVLFSLLFLSSAAGGAGASHDGPLTTHTSTSTKSPGRTQRLSCCPNRSGSSVGLGYMVANDMMLRQDADPSSRLIGRAEGISVGVSLSDSALLTMNNLVFTDGPFNASTLQVLGRVKLASEGFERPILGGTGVFRMARGYTLSKIVKFVNNDRLIYEFDAYVWH